MRYVILLFLLLNVNFCFGQFTYTSPITIHLPAGDIEKINRVITFDLTSVTISTETQEGKDIQKFIIKAYKQGEYLNVGICDFLICSSEDGEYKTHFVMQAVPQIEFIDVIQPPQLNLEEKHYRFLVD